MKIGILTFHYVDNYGAVLQTYALYRYLTSLGCTVEIIDYNNSSHRKKSTKKLSLIRTAIWSNIRKLIFGTKKHEGFELFRINKLNISSQKQINTKLEMIDFLKDGKFDYIFVGSDQVWNPKITGADSSYLLDIDNLPIQRVAYAASIGKSSVDNEWLKRLVEQIKGYKAVSVREKTAVNVIKMAGYDRKISVVADPVFLLDSTLWSEVAAQDDIPSNYILCYIMPGDNLIETNIEQTAKLMSKEHGLKLVFLGRREYKYFKKDGEDYIYASPELFLELFKNAGMILTNSFHGTAFSIIFQKNFYSFVNTNLSPERQLGSRIIDLLEICGLSSRCSNSIVHEFSSIDYEIVNNCVRGFVDKSEKFISESLL